MTPEARALQIAEIKSTNGYQIIIDSNLYESLAKYSWWVSEIAGRPSHVHRTTRKKSKCLTIQMSNQIMGYKKGFVIDHVNRNPLDNRRENLRLITRKQNSYNRGKHKPSIGGSMHKGIYFDRRSKRWLAHIIKNKKHHHLGSFSSEEMAATAYNEMARKFFGKYAVLNNVQPIDKTDPEWILNKKRYAGHKICNNGHSIKNSSQRRFSGGAKSACKICYYIGWAFRCFYLRKENKDLFK